MQGGSVPAQNVYQCRAQEEKAAATLKKTSSHQSDKELGAGAVTNGNNLPTGPTASNSLNSFHSQVCALGCTVSRVLSFWR